MGRRKNAIPERWEVYDPIGGQIKGTQFVCFKVPLRKDICRNMHENLRFTPEDLLRQLAERNLKLGLLIDLTDTYRYYDANEVTYTGTEYRKIRCPGKVIPPPECVNAFRDTVTEFLDKTRSSDASSLIGVHCTHGLNRSGYMICRYMMEQLCFTPGGAVAAFNAARGHCIERQEYIDALEALQQGEDRAGYPTNDADQSRRPSQTTGEEVRSRLRKTARERMVIVIDEDGERTERGRRFDRKHRFYRPRTSSSSSSSSSSDSSSSDTDFSSPQKKRSKYSDLPPTTSKYGDVPYTPYAPAMMAPYPYYGPPMAASWGSNPPYNPEYNPDFPDEATAIPPQPAEVAGQQQQCAAMMATMMQWMMQYQQQQQNVTEPSKAPSVSPSITPASDGSVKLQIDEAEESEML